MLSIKLTLNSDASPCIKQMGDLMAREARFEFYFFSVLLVLCIGTGVYFAFYLSWNRATLPIALLCVATISLCRGRNFPCVAEVGPIDFK